MAELRRNQGESGEAGRARRAGRPRPLRWRAAGGALAVSVLSGLCAAPIVGLGSSEALASQPGVSKRAWLGVELEKGTAGILLKRVLNQSPAAQAGLQSGDLVTNVDGVVVDEPKQLVARVAIAGPGGTMALKYKRGGKDQSASVTLVPFPGVDQILRLDKVGTAAPAFKGLQSVSGKMPSDIASLRGKVVIVDFWAVWCQPCKLVAPHLTKWHTTYSSKGLSVIGLTSDAAPIASKGANQWGMRYAIASDSQEETARAYGVQAMPTMFIIDKKGVIRDVAVGFDPSSLKSTEKLIKTLLAEPAPPKTP